MQRGLLIAVGVVLMLTTVGSGQNGPSYEGVEQALAKYVARNDENYKWTKRHSGKIGTTEFVEARLTSQKWKDILWKHQLFVLKPTSTDPTNKHALLFITGGSWKPALDQPPGDDSLPREARLLAVLAERLKTPVVILQQIPFQPMFDGKHEDQIIALTFEKYLRSGDTDWPLLLPMVKSAVRGMDAAQEIARQQWDQPLSTYTVTGASKRGWTTWLTGAIDQRAIALAPMVIDVLNMKPQMEHQKTAWGDFSSEIDDYTDRGIQDQMSTEGGKALRRIVDPFSYRSNLLQPKLIMIGTNDDYWPLDALDLYWNELKGPKYILYVPNNRHSLQDMTRVTGSLNAIHQHVARGFKLPQLKWKITNSDGKLSFTLSSDKPINQVNAWTASSKSRDFRKSKWSSQAVKADNGSYQHAIDVPETGYVAMFGEAVFNGLELPYFLSTNVKIAGSAPPQ